MTVILANIKIIKTEFFRKSIHFLIALSPLMAVWNRLFTITFLMAGILFYIYLENLRIRGIVVPLFSNIVAKASRPRDDGKFVMGPVTLGLGALLCLLFFPVHTAAIAIYALAFGDGFASLIGKPFGKTRPAFLFGKSLEGSLACLAAVFVTTLNISRSLPVSLMAAFTAAVVEALPLEDYDNIALPLTVAIVISLI